jgi:hypothetical protein
MQPRHAREEQGDYSHCDTGYGDDAMKKDWKMGSSGILQGDFRLYEPVRRIIVTIRGREEKRWIPGPGILTLMGRSL